MKSGSYKVDVLVNKSGLTGNKNIIIKSFTDSNYEWRLSYCAETISLFQPMTEAVQVSKEGYDIIDAAIIAHELYNDPLVLGSDYCSSLDKLFTVVGAYLDIEQDPVKKIINLMKSSNGNNENLENDIREILKEHKS